MDEKQYEQPPSRTFSIYDVNTPSSKPDVTTPLKQAIVTTEDRIRHAEIEIGVFFSQEGRVISRRQGDVNSISFNKQELLAAQKSYFTHNHPNGNTFSRSDIETASELELSEIRVVTKNLRFSMSTNSRGWPSKTDLQKALDELNTKANDVVKNMINTDEVHPKFATVEKNHQLWLLVANKFGLLYTREKS